MRKPQVRPKVTTITTEESTSERKSRLDNTKNLSRESSVSARRESSKSTRRESIGSTKRESLSSTSSHAISETISTPNTKAHSSSDLFALGFTSTSASGSSSASKKLTRNKSSINTTLDTSGSKSVKTSLPKTDEKSKPNTSLNETLKNFFYSKKAPSPKPVQPNITTESLNEDNIVEQLNEITKELATNKALSQKVRANSPLRNVTNMDDKLKKLANILSLETKDSPVKTNPTPTSTSPLKSKNKKDLTSPIIINAKANTSDLSSTLFDEENKDHKSVIIDEPERTSKKRKRESTDIDTNINQNNILDILNKYKTSTQLSAKKKETSPFLKKSPIRKSSATKEINGNSASRKKNFFSKKGNTMSDNEQETDDDLEDLALPSSMHLNK